MGCNVFCETGLGMAVCSSEEEAEYFFAFGLQELGKEKIERIEEADEAMWNESDDKALMGSVNDYEEVHRQQLEENKRRMEELNLTGLATSLKQVSNMASKSAKRSSNPRKQRTEERAVVERRSSRVANNPPPDYREAPIDIPYVWKSYDRRSIFSHAISSVEASREAVEHAYNIESGLGSTYPTFVKPMLHSHISTGFWLGLPADFYKTHLPK